MSTLQADALSVDDFPSEAWFARIVADAKDRPEVYRSLGVASFRLVIEITEAPGHARRFGLVLDGYDIDSAGEIVDLPAFAPDATITAPLEAWKEMLANIEDNGGADRLHSLNALTLAEVPMRVTAADPMGRDRFFRYVETLQTLFDSIGRPSALSP